MVHLQELILCATQPTSPTSGPGTISLHDIQTGSTLASFKQTSAGLHSTAVVRSGEGMGGFVLAAQPDKAVLNVYYFQKDQLALKIILPEKVSCIATDPRGTYCAAGTSQGRIYLWEAPSGIMYNAWDAHYRKINVLRFTQDGAALVSGSEDSGVSVWSVVRLVDDTTQNELPTPYYSLSDHTLPVTDIAVGVGRFPKCRILTSSLDHSVKAWDLTTGTLLTTFLFPHPITTLAWDVTERLFFASSSSLPSSSSSSSTTTNGSTIYQVNLFKSRDDKLSRVLEAVGGGGATDVVRLTDEDEEAKRRVIHVGQEITTLTLSHTSSLLLVGTSTGQIHTYDIASHQLLRTISTHKGSSTITHIMTMLKPPDLVGHVSLNFGSGGNVNANADERVGVPVRSVGVFQRVREPRGREGHEVLVMLPSSKTKTADSFPTYTTSELTRDYSSFVQNPAGGGGGGSSQASNSGARVMELEAEVQRLREQLGKAKGINDAMWDTVVRKVVVEGVKGKGGEAMEVDGTAD
ncbi:WD40-repeat-containing domain protein [Irpex lacteus]|nr:WD40-repeat-containing domain protein [Irpex lacteus]